MSEPNNTPALAQKAILSTLLILSPFAVLFPPYERIYTGGVWRTPWHLDPLYLVRAGLIVVGMTCAALSVPMLIWNLSALDRISIEYSVSYLILQVSMAICSLTIEWAAFPYWVNGVFRALLCVCTRGREYRLIWQDRRRLMQRRCGVLDAGSHASVGNRISGWRSKSSRCHMTQPIEMRVWGAGLSTSSAMDLLTS